MAKYFNTLGTPMTLQLVGKSVSIPAKSFATIEGMDEATNAVQRAVANGKLKRMPEAPTIPPEPVKEEVPYVMGFSKMPRVTPGDTKDKQAKAVKAVEKPKEKVENIATIEISKTDTEESEKKAL